MALAIDASTPAVVTQTNGAVATVTTASFTPPANSLLLIRWAANSDGGTNPSTPTITDSLGAHLTYTLIDWESRANSPARDGQAAQWWAAVGSSAAMTVTVTSGVAVLTNRQAALHVTVLTGQDAVPIGAHGKAGSTSTASIAQPYTAQATSGWGFIAISDWDDKGAETAGSGCTLTNGGSGSIPGQISYGFLRRTLADDSNGVSNTLNVTLPGGSSTNLSWVYAEVLPAGGGGGGSTIDGTATLAATSGLTAVGSTSAGAALAASSSATTPATQTSNAAITGAATLTAVATQAAPAALAATGSLIISAAGAGSATIGASGSLGATVTQTAGATVGATGSLAATGSTATTGALGATSGLTARATVISRAALAASSSLTVAVASVIDGTAAFAATSSLLASTGSRIVHRPNTGTVGRPNSGSVTRPSVGVVTRPDSGRIIRPNTGITIRP